MTHIKLNCTIVFLFIAFCSCGQKHKDNPAAIALNKQAMAIMMHASFDDSDSVRKAVLLLDSATAIDSDYFLGYYNKLVFLDELKEYDKALSTVNKLIQLRPYDQNLYTTGGLLCEHLGVSASSPAYFKKSLEICNRVLDPDTMTAKNDNYFLLMTTKATNLYMLNDSLGANETLKKLYNDLQQQPEDDFGFIKEEKRTTQWLMNRNKKELMEGLLNGKEDATTQPATP